MRLSVLTIIAASTMIAFSSCKKEKPSYCGNDYFGEIILTDATGTATTSFGAGATMNLNLLFVNGASDTVNLTYSEPWVTYELYQGSQLIAASNNANAGTGVSGLKVAPSDTVQSFYAWSANQGALITEGSYTFKAKGTYQYKDCEEGIKGFEKSVDFTVTQ